MRQYLAQHEASIPGSKDPTDIPTATVVFESFATVTRVELALEDMTTTQIQGWQAHHELICQAVELVHSIYEVLTTQENYATMGKGLEHKMHEMIPCVERNAARDNSQGSPRNLARSELLKSKNLSEGL